MPPSDPTQTQQQVSVVATPWGMVPEALIKWIIKDVPLLITVGLLVWLLHVAQQQAAQNLKALQQLETSVALIRRDLDILLDKRVYSDPVYPSTPLR